MTKAPTSNQLSPIGLQILWNRLIGVVEEQARLPGQGHLVALADDGMAQGGNHLCRVGQLLLGGFAVTHRGAGVEKEMADEVRLHFILLDEQGVAREEDPPVNMLGVVAPDILAMSGELHGKARLRRFMRPGQVAQHQTARLDLPLRQPA